MGFRELVVIAWQGILSNKLRSRLTVLGIVIGIASVITLMGIGEGAKRKLKNKFNHWASTLYMFDPAPPAMPASHKGKEPLPPSLMTMQRQ